MLRAFCGPERYALQLVLLQDVIQSEQRAFKDAGKDCGTTVLVCSCNASEAQHA